MRKLLLIPVIALAIFTLYTAQKYDKQVSVPEPTPTQVQTEKPVETPKKWTAEELLKLTNDIRTENNVKPLELDPNLNESAQMKLDEMTRENNFDHVSLEGKHGYEYIAETTDYCYFGSENLTRAYNYNNPILGFKGSPSHWQAIINNDFESVGYAIADNYFVIHFCDKDPN